MSKCVNLEVVHFLKTKGSRCLWECVAGAVQKKVSEEVNKASSHDVDVEVLLMVYGTR